MHYLFFRKTKDAALVFVKKTLLHFQDEGIDCGADQC